MWALAVICRGTPAPPQSQHTHGEQDTNGRFEKQRALTHLKREVERRHQGHSAIRPAQPVRHLPVVIAWVREAPCQESHLRRGLVTVS